MSSPEDPARDRAYHVKRGALWGAAVAAGYFPIGLLKYHLTIASLGQFGPQTWAQVFALLVVFGAGVGSAVGLLRPLLAWGKLGAALIGFIVTFPVMFIIFAADSEIQTKSIVPVLVVAAVSSGILGGIGGGWLHHIFDNGDPSRD